MLIIMLLSKLVRGPGGGKESIFGFKICDAGAWISLIVMILFAGGLTFLASWINNKVY